MRTSSIVWILPVLQSTVIFACSSSSKAPPTLGPNCTALEVCCNSFVPLPDGGLNPEQDDCNQTVQGFETNPQAETACESALKMYAKDHSCTDSDGG